MLDVSRKEFKYLLDVKDMYYMKERLEKIMQQDEHNGDRGYVVRSLYFDSSTDRDYNEKLDGLNNRKKIRIRTYGNNPNVIKLELKAKESDFQRKRSLSINRDEAQQMIQGEYLFLLERPEGLARALYTMLTTQMYRPKSIVEYDRIAYIYDVNDIRITFDCNIRTSLCYEAFFDDALEMLPVSAPNEITMEVKYNNFLFSQIKQVIGLADQPRISNSKYIAARSMFK